MGFAEPLGRSQLHLARLLSAPLKQTPEAMIRVHDEYLDIKDAHTG